MAKKLKKEVQPQSLDDIALLGINYVAAKDAEKKIKSEINTLRKPLESFMDAHEHTLPNGSKLLEVSHADTLVSLKRTLRSGKELVPEAEDILKENGLEDCLETITIIREDRIESLYNAGKITDKLLASIYKAKDSYAFSVSLSKKNEIPEV